MFDNIGSKIKGLAKWVYSLGGIASVILAVVLLADEVVSPLICILIAVGGALSFMVAAWFLYGFGELIEQTSQNQRNTRKIAQLLEERHSPQNTPSPAAPITPVTRKPDTNGSHMWRCPHCGKGRTQTPCEYCGNE